MHLLLLLLLLSSAVSDFARIRISVVLVCLCARWFLKRRQHFSNYLTRLFPMKIVAAALPCGQPTNWRLISTTNQARRHSDLIQWSVVSGQKTNKQQARRKGQLSGHGEHTMEIRSFAVSLVFLYDAENNGQPARKELFLTY